MKVAFKNEHKKEVNTFYSGIHSGLDVDLYFKYEDDIFNLYANGRHQYVEKTTQSAFDIDGNYLGKFQNEKQFEKIENKKIDTTLFYYVIQLNYHFYKIKYSARTIPELQKLQNILLNSKLIKLSEVNNQFIEKEINSFYDGKVNKNRSFYYEPFEPLEICYTGCNYNISNPTGKKLYYLDIKAYRERKNDFVKNNPNLKDEVESIYANNIDYLMRFWDCSKNQLLHKNFNRLDYSIKKLNRKINNKLKSS